MTRLLPAAAAMLLAAAAPMPPPGASTCSGCHSPASMPLSGLSADAIGATMLAYRSGAAPSTIMGRLMKGLTPQQIQAIAAWVAVPG